MNKPMKIALVLAALLVVSVVIDHFAYRPGRTAGAFVSHLSHERYEDAASMLSAPSDIEVTSDGGLILTDHAGNTMTVPKARLPFLSGGGDPEDGSDFAMTALQGSKRGRVDGTVTISLVLDGRRVRIEQVRRF